MNTPVAAVDGVKVLAVLDLRSLTTLMDSLAPRCNLHTPTALQPFTGLRSPS